MSTDVRREVIELLLNGLELNKAYLALAFLHKGFSARGQAKIAELIICFNQQGLTVENILKILEYEWHHSWQYQDPEIRANPHARMGVGLKNLTAFKNVRAKLRLLKGTKTSQENPSTAPVS